MRPIVTHCLLLAAGLLGLLPAASAQGRRPVPASYALPASVPDPTQPEKWARALPGPDGVTRQGQPTLATVADRPPVPHCEAAEAWAARYNGPASGYDEGRSVAVDAQGNVYVTGYSSNGANNDYVTVKYDRRTGRQLWAARYNGLGNGEDRPTGIAVSLAGDVYVTGYSFTGTSNDFVTIKYHERTGQIIWLARYNGPANSDDIGTGVAVDIKGDAYVTGNSNSGGQNFDYATIRYDRDTGRPIWAARYNGPANYIDTPVAIVVSAQGEVNVTGYSYFGSSYDYLTVQYDRRNGQQQWASRYNGPDNGDDLATSLAVSLSGEVYVTGYSANGSNTDMATVKYDRRTGRRLWAERYNGTANRDDVAGGVAVDTQGNAYVTGFSFNSTNTDYITVKHDGRTGRQVWKERYNGPDNSFEGATAIGVTLGGEVYVTGYSANGNGNRDYATIRYDQRTGQPVWVARYDDGGDDVASALAVTLAGDVYVTGFAGNNMVTVQYDRHTGLPCFPGNRTADAARAGTPDVSPATLDAHPNPAGPRTLIRFRLATAATAQLQVYNQLGALVATLYDGSVPAGVEQSVELPTAGLPGGVYLCRLRHDGKTEQFRLLIQP